MSGWRDWPSNEQSEADLLRRPPTVHDDDDELPALAADPIAVVEWQVPLDDDELARHDVGAFRRDEVQDAKEGPKCQA